MPSPSLGWPRHRGFMCRAITQGRWGSCIVHYVFTQRPFTVLPILCSFSKCGQLELSSLVIFRTLKTSFRRAKLQKRRAFAQKSCRRAWAGELATMKHYALCIIYCANTLLSSDNIRTKGQAVGIVHCEICIIYCALSIVHALSIVKMKYPWAMGIKS